MELFTKVHCKAYMKKISDGVHISIYEKYDWDASEDSPFGGIHRKLSEQRTIDGNETVLAEDAMGNVLKDLSSCEGESVHKKYWLSVIDGWKSR